MWFRSECLLGKIDVTDLLSVFISGADIRVIIQPYTRLLIEYEEFMYRIYKKDVECTPKLISKTFYDSFDLTLNVFCVRLFFMCVCVCVRGVCV